MGSDDKVYSYEPPYQKFINFWADFFEKPVIWFRENVVVPNRQEYYWYHEKLRRVPTIDQCYTDDLACMFEANEQYKRDRQVDKFILQILKRRCVNCLLENEQTPESCKEIEKAYDRAIDNYFIKYGDLGLRDNALNCLVKQKNRMAWERRHGPVGSGRKPEKEVHHKKKEKTC